MGEDVDDEKEAGARWKTTRSKSRPTPALMSREIPTNARDRVPAAIFFQSRLVLRLVHPSQFVPIHARLAQSDRASDSYPNVCLAI